MAYYNDGNPQAAITFLQEAIRLDPDFAEAYKSLSVVYRELGLAREARIYSHKFDELSAKSANGKKA
ncbi:Tetratricopeptide repeat protein [uncultured archaeon]|nr:Tetratricopeptide repeat protein [uncultured archaeon]